MEGDKQVIVVVGGYVNQYLAGLLWGGGLFTAAFLFAHFAHFKML